MRWMDPQWINQAIEVEGVFHLGFLDNSDAYYFLTEPIPIKNKNNYMIIVLILVVCIVVVFWRFIRRFVFIKGRSYFYA